MKRFLMSIVAAAGLAGAAHAQQMSLGEYEYRNSCVVCHGEDGTGHGMLEGRFDPLPPDLTTLAKTNGGVFPLQRVYDVIDGTDEILWHGTRQMPMWGNRYRDRLTDDPDYSYTAEDRETYARTRILALIEYLSTIQKE